MTALLVMGSMGSVGVCMGSMGSVGVCMGSMGSKGSYLIALYPFSP